MEPYCVILPIRSEFLGKGLQEQPARYFLERGVSVIFCPNGSFLPGWRLIGVENKDQVLVAENVIEPNPYPARNKGLALANLLARWESYVLLDGDVTPQDDFHEIMLDVALSNRLYAGRVLTTVGDTLQTKHFNSLRAAKFECYDGYRPDNICVGANMVIGADVYRALGDMKCSRSGGDADYSLRAEKIGFPTIPVPQLVVRKNIHTLSMLGMIQKQALRGASDPLPKAEGVDEMMMWLEAADSLHELAYHARRYAHDPSDEEYAGVADKLMLALYRLGVASQHMDSPDDRTRSNRDT